MDSFILNKKQNSISIRSKYAAIKWTHTTTTKKLSSKYIYFLGINRSIDRARGDRKRQRKEYTKKNIINRILVSMTNVNFRFYKSKTEYQTNNNNNKTIKYKDDNRNVWKPESKSIKKKILTKNQISFSLKTQIKFMIISKSALIFAFPIGSIGDFRCHWFSFFFFIFDYEKNCCSFPADFFFFYFYSAPFVLPPLCDRFRLLHFKNNNYYIY